MPFLQNYGITVKKIKKKIIFLYREDTKSPLGGNTLYAEKKITTLKERKSKCWKNYCWNSFAGKKKKKKRLKTCLSVKWNGNSWHCRWIEEKEKSVYMYRSLFLCSLSRWREKDTEKCQKKGLFSFFIYGEGIITWYFL